MILLFWWSQPIDPQDYRREWELRCDTPSELKDWSESIAEALIFANANERGKVENSKFITID
jgi:hypothetical protein